MKWRWVFVLLLLANVLFFVAMRFGGAPAGESLRGHAPFHADKVRLLGTAPQAQAAPPAEAAPPAQAKPEAAAICLEWGGLSAVQLTSARQALEKLQLGDKLVVRDAGERPSYWVLIPPRNSRQEAEKKLAEVKALGIEDVALVQENGKLRNAVSLGVFSTREAANKYLAAVQEKGVRLAMVQARGKAAGEASFFVRNASETVSAELVKMKLAFPGSELKAVACDEATQEGGNK